MDIFALIRGLPKITQIGVLTLDGRFRWRFGRLMGRIHPRDRRCAMLNARNCALIDSMRSLSGTVIVIAENGRVTSKHIASLYTNFINEGLSLMIGNSESRTFRLRKYDDIGRITLFIWIYYEVTIQQLANSGSTRTICLESIQYGLGKSSWCCSEVYEAFNKYAKPS